jgi:hypothetical protein
VEEGSDMDIANPTHVSSDQNEFLIALLLVLVFGVVFGLRRPIHLHQLKLTFQSGYGGTRSARLLMVV